MACVQPSGLKKRPPPACPGPDFLATQDDIICFVRIKNFSGITKQLNFISAELKKSYIYLHCSKNNAFLRFFFFLHIFINTSQPNRDAGTGHEVTAGGTDGGTALAELTCKAWLPRGSVPSLALRHPPPRAAPLCPQRGKPRTRAPRAPEKMHFNTFSPPLRKHSTFCARAAAML